MRSPDSVRGRPVASVSAGLSASDPSEWLPTDQAAHLPTEPGWRSTRPGGADAVGRSARLLLGLLLVAAGAAMAALGETSAYWRLWLAGLWNSIR